MCQIHRVLSLPCFLPLSLIAFNVNDVKTLNCNNGKNSNVFLFLLFKLIYCLELLNIRDSPHYKAFLEGVTNCVLCKRLWLCLPLVWKSYQGGFAVLRQSCSAGAFFLFPLLLCNCPKAGNLSNGPKCGRRRKRKNRLRRRKVRSKLFRPG